LRFWLDLNFGVSIAWYKFKLRFWFDLEFAVDENVPTIQDFDERWIQHFESHLAREGLYHSLWLQTSRSHSHYSHACRLVDLTVITVMNTNRAACFTVREQTPVLWELALLQKSPIKETLFCNRYSKGASYSLLWSGYDENYSSLLQNTVPWKS